jgi:hypothetical protein
LGKESAAFNRREVRCEHEVAGRAFEHAPGSGLDDPSVCWDRQDALGGDAVMRRSAKLSAIHNHASI